MDIMVQVCTQVFFLTANPLFGSERMQITDLRSKKFLVNEIRSLVLCNLGVKKI